MGTPLSTIEACKADLFTSEAELREKYPAALAERVMRLREMYNYWLANPSIKDRQLRDQIMSRYGLSQSAAYSDISAIRQLVPLLASESKAYHRARANELTLETYAMAKARKDTKTMAQCIATYGKINGLDKPDEYTPEYDQIAVQPFCATLDVTVLGVKAIPDVYNYIQKLTKDLLRDHTDIDDVGYEEADLEEEHLFAPLRDGTDEPESEADIL